ncbi:hypothetical protein [uncultured Tateyamaria sp.]|uniref:hypothetical protein n=1 Tax=uncultured Tateyamaria sp. TaxID=455651 RepID=UPI00260E5FF7|nr:hypothetical protein [uncultured Tateyamaria sp.]
MSSSTAKFELYNILLEQGIEKRRAEAAVNEFVTREEARHTLATKDDMSALKDQLRSVIMWVAGLLVGQIAIMTAIMAVMFSIYS